MGLYVGALWSEFSCSSLGSIDPLPAFGPSASSRSQTGMCLSYASNFDFSSRWDELAGRFAFVYTYRNKNLVFPREKAFALGPSAEGFSNGAAASPDPQMDLVELF